MKFEISYLSDKDIVHLEVAGAYDAINGLPVISAMQEEAKRYGCLNWLLDMRATVAILTLSNCTAAPMFITILI